MSARIIELSRIAALRGRDRSAGPQSDEWAGVAGDVPLTFRFWQGVSGERYVHTVYSLIDCPELPRANYLLVHNSGGGHQQVLRVARTRHAAPSLNLAEIRHRGARLGANEVHVHLLAGDDRARRLVEFELRASLMADAASQGVKVTRRKQDRDRR